MDKEKSEFERAKFTYYFKETFRAHSRAEYREIFSRGLNEDNGGITGAFPWLYVRVFFALLILFTVNLMILRLTNNTLYVPSVTFLGGITFIVPFIVLLYELYPKRDISLFVLLAVLVGGGVAAGALSQLCYAFINVNNPWLSAVVAGTVEEVCKLIPAIVVIFILKKKNRYACFLIAAAVGAGFSVIEDMGYIFYYSDKYVFYYHSDIQATVAIFLDRGLSSFCTHILWTGAIGWAYSLPSKPFRSVWLIIFCLSVGLHICWDLPLTGWLQALDIALCVIIAAAVNITIVHKSRINTLISETDLTRLNAQIIREAKQIGERLRFTNAANLTFALTCALLSVIIILLCALPIGMEFMEVNYASKEEFIEFIEGGYNLKADFDRAYDENGTNAEELLIDGETTYVVQTDRLSGYEGLYYYGYYVDDFSKPYNIAVELDDLASRIYCSEYEFGSETILAFDVCSDLIREYFYNNDGTVTAVTDAEEFEGYGVLIALCGTGCAIAMGSTVILVAFRIKLRRVKDERQ